MILKSEKVLARFRGPGRCLACGKPCEVLDPHHLLGKGAGGSDVSWNLAGLCRECHNRVQEPSCLEDDILKDDVLQRTALLNQTTVAAIEEARSWLLRLPKGLPLERIELHMRELSAEASRLITQAFAEADE